MTIKLKTNGLSRALRDIRKAAQQAAADSFATVGVHESAGIYVKDGQTTATVAAANHFGTDHIPARPFLDKGVEREKDTITKESLRLLKRGVPIVRVLEAVGTIAVRGIQQQIDETFEPPNSPETIKRKGSSHPLIDTGHLRQSISFEIHKGGR